MTRDRSYVLQLSAGTFTEDIILSRLNYCVSGSPCALFAQSTVINGSCTVGLAGVATKSIKLSNVIVTGNLIITSYNLQQLNHTFSNCEFRGTLTIPDDTNTTGGFFAFL